MASIFDQRRPAGMTEVKRGTHDHVVRKKGIARTKSGQVTTEIQWREKPVDVYYTMQRII
jgi:hypothetical protein